MSTLIYSICERNGWISGQQAGFRKSRCVEDQIIRVAHAVLVVFQEQQRSVMALLDFSKAYETVWRQRLLKTLIEKRLNDRYVLWLSLFLENRQTRVRLNGSISRIRRRKLPASLVPTRKKRGPWRKRYTSYKRVCRKILQCQCWQVTSFNVPLCLESLQA